MPCAMHDQHNVERGKIMDIHEKAKTIAQDAIRLNNDINGNPRYYISCVSFMDDNHDFYRPPYAKMYRGKKYGAGWVFQSYSLEKNIRDSLLASANPQADRCGGRLTP